ncbi:unnamed protein product [Staurois parvus]|uniref:Uncharacterized protein n=1 Tax=Staurois parvus TaxID=386267 RepID=A0ABN9GMW9_9NEOB|nr:unnamed protein product [Staurois parvus]
MLCFMCFFCVGACDWHRANQHCPDRGSGVMKPKAQKTTYSGQPDTAEH